MPRGVNPCPNCGEPVSQFAAGCALCGANLIAARRRQEERYESFPLNLLRRPGWFPDMSGQNWVLAGLLMLCALFVPVITVFIAGAIAYFANRSGETVQRNIALLALAVALILVIFISFVEEWPLLTPWLDPSKPVPG